MASLGELAAHVGARLRGDDTLNIDGVATLQNAHAGQISFLTNPRYRKYLSTTHASAVVVSEEHADACPSAVLISSNPYAAFARISSYLNPISRPAAGIHASASVAASANIDATATIGAHVTIEADAEIGAQVIIAPGCFIGRGARIGANGYVHSNVSILHEVVIGERVMIYPGAVIGADGFGLAMYEGQWIKVPQLGTVIIGDDVEIGSNTTVDRGALGNTVIEDGVKLDNLIQVAHNVHIGAHTAIAGCAGIAGSVSIGKYCTIAGGVGISGHLELGDHVHVTAMSMVTRSLPEAGVYSSGMSVDENKSWNRNAARFRHLDDMAKRLRRIEKTVCAEVPADPNSKA